MIQKISKINIDKIRNLYFDRQYNLNQVAGRLGISYWPLYGFMNKNNIPRRLPTEANYVVSRNKSQFRIKEKISVSEEKLKIAGIMLYWAEGAANGNTVDFVNSNPQMIKIFLKFLREICGIGEDRLRVYLYAYQNQNLKELMQYWSNITNVPISQFTKPYIRIGNLNLTKRKLPYGLVHLRYNDKKLLVLIKSWIAEYTIWAGTQVVKGGRLCKRSVLSKGMMEK